MNRASLFVVTALWSEFALAQTTLTPDNILRQISSTGAGPTLNKIYNSHSDWDKLLQKIGTGEDAWMRVAVGLRSASDAGTSSQLNFAVGEALEHSPSVVLKIAVPTFSVDEVCASPDIDSTKYDSYSLAINAIELRKKKVKAIPDSRLAYLRDKCIHALESAKSGVAGFYGVTR